MTTLQQHFDEANATPITTANSELTNSDGFDSISATGMTMSYSTEQKMHGTSAMKVTMTSTTSSNGAAVWTTNSIGSVTSFSWRSYVYLTGLPSAPVNLVQAIASDSQSLSLLNVFSTGQIGSTMDNSNTGSHVGYTVPTGSFTMAANHWYRFEGTVVLANNGTGSLLMRVYDGDSTTVLATLNPTGINTTTGAGATLGSIRFGKNTSAPTMGSYYFDDLGFADGTSALGPYAPGAPSVIAANILNGSALTLNETAFTYDNNTPTFAWVQTAGPTVTLSSASAASPTATLTVAGSYSFQVTITDDLGKTATSTTSVTYAGSVNAPAASGSLQTGQWVEQVVGVAAAGGALSYSISPATGVGQPAPGIFTGATPSATTSYTVTVTEAGNTNTTTFRFTVPGASTASGSLRILLANNDQSAGGTFS